MLRAADGYFSLLQEPHPRTTCIWIPIFILNRARVNSSGVIRGLPLARPNLNLQPQDNGILAVNGKIWAPLTVQLLFNIKEHHRLFENLGERSPQSPDGPSSILLLKEHTKMPIMELPQRSHESSLRKDVDG